MDDLIRLDTLTDVAAADAVSLARLLGQLSTTATVDNQRFRDVVTHPATDLVVARAGTDIVGMATLVGVPLPSGVRGHVEDVVVEASQRGRGIARRLLLHLTELADERGLRTLDLTSRPTRESALNPVDTTVHRRVVLGGTPCVPITEGRPSGEQACSGRRGVRVRATPTAVKIECSARRP